jgi:hypothetical protein
MFAEYDAPATAKIDGDKADLNKKEDGAGDVSDDNGHLPIGNKVFAMCFALCLSVKYGLRVYECMSGQIAIFLVGLTSPITLALVLPSLMRQIIQPSGIGKVDLFVHTSAVDNMETEDSDIKDLYENGLGGSLKGIVIDGMVTDAENSNPRGKKNALQAWRFRRCYAPHSIVEVDRDRCASGKDELEEEKGGCLVEREECVQVQVGGKHVRVPRIWDPPASYLPYFQFYRLARLYPYMLAEEVSARRRYSHVLRMRTDTILYSIWDQLQQFHEAIPPLSQVVSGPGYNNLRNPSHMVDSFW